MKILITGSGGFIGNHLIDFLKDSHELITLSRSTTTLPEINNFAIDLSNSAQVRNTVNTKSFGEYIDVIIHCAAVLSPINNKDMSTFHLNNEITESMIHIAQATAAKKIINISSIGVYPNFTGSYNEESVIEPSANHECLYSLSKVCSEELFKFFLKDTMQVINLRLGQVYGSGMRSDRIYSIMKHELATTNIITVYGNGERISNFVSIEHLKNKISQIVLNPNIEGTFNLGEENMSYYALAEKIINKFGNSSSKIILNEKGIKSKVFIDSSKLNNL